MKKTNGYNNLNRNNPFNPFHRSSCPMNTLASDIVLSQLWLQDNTPQLEIIELNSDDSEGPLKNEDENVSPRDKYNHVWNYINNITLQNESERSNIAYPSAQERKCTQSGSNFKTTHSEEMDYDVSGVVSDHVCSSVYGDNHNYTSNCRMKSHQNNCFTIMSKLFHSSESSSDEIDIIECDNTRHNYYDCDVTQQSDMLSFDDDVDNNKSTIWIYSIKNKRMLSDNHFEMVNVPSQDCTSSTSHSLDDFCDDLECPVKETTSRVGSPIPTTHIPRLNLKSPRLPTLTEVTEPDKVNINETQPISSHKVNGWFDDRHDRIRSKNHTKNINWMCLSPRERRRRFKHTTTITMHPAKPSVLENEFESKFEDTFSETSHFHKINTKAEINLNSDDKTRENTVLLNKQDPKVNAKNEVFLINIDNINNDGSDNEEHDEGTIQRPKIVIQNNKVLKVNMISSPIERLDSNSWIHEENKERLDTIKEQRSIQTETTINNLAYPEDCAGNRLWARNISLLKPAEWKEYRAITDSIPTLELSVDSDPKRKTWLYRLAACFRCCK